MARSVIRRDGRSGQNEASGLAGMAIDFATNVVPDLGNELPFVDQARAVAFQEYLRCDEPSRSGIVVDVKPDLAPGDTASRLGLSATTRSFNDDGPEGPEVDGKFSVDDARPIVESGR